MSFSLNDIPALSVSTIGTIDTVDTMGTFGTVDTSDAVDTLPVCGRGNVRHMPVNSHKPSTWPPRFTQHTRHTEAFSMIVSPDPSTSKHNMPAVA